MLSRSSLMVYIIVAFTLLLLGGCRIELYSELDESSANEILALLQKNGIEARKIKGKESWGVEVDETRISTAMELLKQAGLPREKFTSIGEVFEKKGLISSPLEERIRFIYALAQELSATISEIDGVITARVHIVLPEQDTLSDILHPSSASVFIKHHEDADIEENIPQIKKLIVNSIEELTYDKITVVLFPSVPAQIADTPTYTKIVGIKVARESARLFQWILVGSGVFTAFLCFSLIILALRLRTKVEIKS